MALFHVRMDVRTPLDLGAAERAEVLARERDYSQQLQRGGKWVCLWRVVGRYSSISIFDVGSAEELHEILWNLPLFEFMAIEVTPLTEHPNAISAR